MLPKSERFEMRLDQEVLSRIDLWRSSQRDLPSRAESIRQFIGLGLGEAGYEQARISDGERLILIMLRDLYKHHKVKGEIDPDFVSSSIWGGHLWGLSWEYNGLFAEHEDRMSTVKEVVDILDMWAFIETAYQRMSKKEKDIIKVGAAPFGESVLFVGFDGNNESDHLSVSLFLINDLKRFQDFKNRGLNSHSPKLESYRRMVSKFADIRSKLDGRGLNVAEIIALLKAKYDQ